MLEQAAGGLEITGLLEEIAEIRLVDTEAQSVDGDGGVGRDQLLDSLQTIPIMAAGGIEAAGGVMEIPQIRVGARQPVAIFRDARMGGDQPLEDLTAAFMMSLGLLGGENQPRRMRQRTSSAWYRLSPGVAWTSPPPRW